MSSTVQENLLDKLQGALGEKSGKAPRAVFGLLNDTLALSTDGACAGPDSVLDALSGWEEEDRLGLLLAASDLRGQLNGLARQLLPLLRKRFRLLTGYPDPVEAEERAEVLVTWLLSEEATRRLGELQKQSSPTQAASPVAVREVSNPPRASETGPRLPVEQGSERGEEPAEEKTGERSAQEQANTPDAAVESHQEASRELAEGDPDSDSTDKKTAEPTDNKTASPADNKAAVTTDNKAAVTKTVESERRDPNSEKKAADRLRDRWLRMVLTCLLAEKESRAMRRGLYVLLGWHVKPPQQEANAHGRSMRKRPSADRDLAYLLAQQLAGTSTSWAKKFWQLMRPPMESAERYRVQIDRAIEREDKVRSEVSSLREKLQQREDDLSSAAEQKRTLQAEINRKAEEIAEIQRDFQAEKTNLSRRSQDALARQSTVIQRKLQHEVNEAILSLDDSAPDVAMALRRIQRMQQILAELTQ